MAKFCTKCGRKLEDGKPCPCEKEEKKVEKEENIERKVSHSEPSTDINWYVNSFIDMIKGIFVKPIDTIKKFATEEYFVLGIIVIILNALLTGVMAYLTLEEAGSAISSFGLYSLGFSGIEVPFMKTLLYVALFMIVGFAVSGAMIYVMAGPLFKANTNMKRCIALVGTCASLTLITTILAIICLYISVKVFFIVLLLAGVLYLCHLYHGTQEISNIDENKQGYTFLVAVAVATFVVVYVLPKILF